MGAQSNDAQRVLALDIDQFDLSTRAANCLKNEEIVTVGQLAEKTAEDILKWRNAGQKTLKEIRRLLGRVGLKLSGDSAPMGRLDTKLLTEFGLSSTPNEQRTHYVSEEHHQLKNGGNAISLRTAPPGIQCHLVLMLKDLALSKRAKKVIESVGVVFLGELAQLSLRNIVRIRNSGRKTGRELTEVLAQHGLTFGMSISDWSREDAQTLRQQLQSNLSEILRQHGRELLSSIGPEPTCLEDELLRIARALDGERNSQLLIKLWGWSGAPPRTLDSVGKEIGLTRERVRQIESRALKRLVKYEFETPNLKAALALLKDEEPDIDSLLAKKLRERGVSRSHFCPWGVQIAAQHLRLRWNLEAVSIGDVRILAAAGAGQTISKALSILRKKTSERGCMSLLGLADEARVPEHKVEKLVRLLDLTHHVRWLDEAKEWLYLSEAPRNRLYNLCAKALGVADQLHISELRRAVSRSQRLAMCPPQRILSAFVEQFGLGKVEDGIIYSNPAATAPPAINSAEGRMLLVLDQHGPVLDGEDFAEKCVAAGMNATTHYIYRQNSPVICSLGKGVFCKVGTKVSPGTVEDIVARRRAVSSVSDYGWTPAGKLWFGTELSLQVITAGGLRLVSFVADLVQGDWKVRLPDGTEQGTVTCRGVFLWSVRRALALLGAEPSDMFALEFDLKARTLLVRIGGPDLFEAIQDPESDATEDLDFESQDA